MKALTTRQPYASLAAHKFKVFETRGWSTKYRGRLAWHAAAGFSREEIELCHEEPFASALVAAGYRTADDLPRGVVLGTCQLVEVLPTSDAGVPTDSLVPPAPNEEEFGNYAPGRFAFVLADMKLFPEPIPAKGALGLWEWT